jgi:hypothetical protein
MSRKAQRAADAYCIGKRCNAADRPPIRRPKGSHRILNIRASSALLRRLPMQ